MLSNVIMQQCSHSPTGLFFITHAIRSAYRWLLVMAPFFIGTLKSTLQHASARKRLVANKHPAFCMSYQTKSNQGRNLQE